MSADYVRQLGKEALCQWLKTQLDEDEWIDAQKVILGEKIKVKNFLNYTLDEWVKVVGLSAGVANSLVQIAQGLLGTKNLEINMVPLKQRSTEDILVRLHSNSAML